MNSTFDPKCLELAAAFTEDEPEHVQRQVNDLAAEIQSCIESWLESAREASDVGHADDYKEE